MKKGKPWNLNNINGKSNAFLHVLFSVLSFTCLFPLVFIFMISISSEQSISQKGYSLIPQEFSLNAYEFLWNEKGSIGNALLISAIVTVVGTVAGVLITTAMGYTLSRPNFKLKKFYQWLVFIPMIFNGGMVASYIVIANILGMKDTIWALILPLLVSSFNVIICKTFFSTTIPDAIVESAKIDGASQFTIFFRIVVPISKPVFATIALFLTFGYWNDWFQSSLYISNQKLISLQALLNNMQQSIAYIANNPTAGLSMAQYKSQMPTESIRMAIAVIIVIPIACAYPFFQKYFISGLTVGAVKG